jgi:hypothetical protein
MATTKRKKRELSDDHLAALAEGRTQSAAVRRYLEALEAHKPKRGRKRTTDSIKNRLSRIDAELAEAASLRRLQLMQERTDLLDELNTTAATIDLSELEEGFVSAAKAYGDRKGITYTTWREFGVPASVLKRAGVGRGAG